MEESDKGLHPAFIMTNNTKQSNRIFKQPRCKNRNSFRKMSFNDITSLTPLALALIALIIVLAKMHYSIESISEKVKILFDFHNKRNNK